VRSIFIFNIYSFFDSFSLQSYTVDPLLLEDQREIQVLDEQSIDDRADGEKKKAPNYTEHEDVEICRAWIQISEDPAVGTHQQGDTFWQRVSSNYHEVITSPSRPFGSLKKRWALLQARINKFRACVNQVEQFNESGALAEDQLNRALRLFSRDQNTHFKDLRCYNLLVKCPKWNAYARDYGKKPEASKNKRARSPSSEAPASTMPASTPPPSVPVSEPDGVSDFEGTGTTPSELERPIGKKKAKLALQAAAKEDAWRSQIALAQKKIALESERQNEILKNDSDSLKIIAQSGAANVQLSIMTKDLDGLDEEQREYFKLKRKEIIRSLQPDQTANPTS
jgi:hypothetical protein